MDELKLDALRDAVASVLRAERGRADLSQDQLADLSGISKSTITRWEAGRLPVGDGGRKAAIPDLSQLSAISQALKVEMGSLVADVEKAYKAEVTTLQQSQIRPGAQAELDQLDAKATKRRRSIRPKS